MKILIFKLFPENHNFFLITPPQCRVSQLLKQTFSSFIKIFVRERAN